MLFCSMVMVRVRIRISVWLVSGYSHVFILLSFATVLCPRRKYAGINMSILLATYSRDGRHIMPIMAT